MPITLLHRMLTSAPRKKVSAFVCVCVCKNPTWAYPAITGQENGVALYVPVNDTLRVQVGQGPQHRQTHSGDLLLVHPVRTHTQQQLTRLKSRSSPGLYVGFLPTPFRYPEY